MRADAEPGDMPYFDALQLAHGDNDGGGSRDPGASVELGTRAERGISGGGAALPHLGAIQRAFGKHDVTDVQAHVGGAATEAGDAMGAEAYAMGTHVAFRGAPALHTAAHEAAHVVQQRKGVTLPGGMGQAGDAYEQHADAVADAVVRGESAEMLLEQTPPAPATSSSVQGEPSSSAEQAATVPTAEPSEREPAPEMPEEERQPQMDEPDGATAAAVARTQASVAACKQQIDALVQDEVNAIELPGMAEDTVPPPPGLARPAMHETPEQPPWEESAEAIAEQPIWQEKLDEAQQMLGDAQLRADDNLAQIEDRQVQLDQRRAQREQQRERMAEQAGVLAPAAGEQTPPSQEQEQALDHELDRQQQALKQGSEQASLARNEVDARRAELPDASGIGAWIAEDHDIAREFEERAAAQQELRMADMEAQQTAVQTEYEQRAQQMYQDAQADIAAQQQAIQQQTKAEIAAVQHQWQARNDTAHAEHLARIEALSQETDQQINATTQQAETRAQETLTRGRDEAQQVESQGQQQIAGLLESARQRAAQVRAVSSGEEPTSAGVQMKARPAVQLQETPSVTQDSTPPVTPTQQADDILREAYQQADDLETQIRIQVERIVTASGEDAQGEIQDAQAILVDLLNNHEAELCTEQGTYETFVFDFETEEGQISVIFDANATAAENLAQFRFNQLNDAYHDDALRHSTGSIRNFSDANPEFSYDLTYDYEMLECGDMNLVFDYGYQDGGVNRTVIGSTILPYEDIITLDQRSQLEPSDRRVTANVFLQREFGTARSLFDENWMFTTTAMDYSVENRMASSNIDFAGCGDLEYTTCIANTGYDFNAALDGGETDSLRGFAQDRGWDTAVLEHSVARFGIVDLLVEKRLTPDPTLTNYQDDIYTNNTFPPFAAIDPPEGAVGYNTVVLNPPNAPNEMAPLPAEGANVIYDAFPWAMGTTTLTPDGSIPSDGHTFILDSNPGNNGNDAMLEYFNSGLGHFSFASFYHNFAPGECPPDQVCKDDFPSRFIPYSPINDRFAGPTITADNINALVEGNRGLLSGDINSSAVAPANATSTPDPSLNSNTGASTASTATPIPTPQPTATQPSSGYDDSLANSTLYVGNQVNLREGPSVGSRSLALIAGGQPVTLTGNIAYERDVTVEGVHYDCIFRVEVTYGGQTGWIPGSYVGMNKPCP